MKYLSLILVLFIGCHVVRDGVDLGNGVAVTGPVLEANFTHTISGDSFIVGGKSYPVIDGFDKVYMYGDTVYYFSQISVNNHLRYNYESDRMMHNFGTVVHNNGMPFVLMETPLRSYIKRVNSGSAIDIDSVGADSLNVYINNRVVSVVDTLYSM